MPGRRYPDWESFDFAGAATDGPAVDGPVAFGADLSPASVLGAYRRGVVPLPAADEHLRTINEFRYEDLVADGTIALVGSRHGDPYRVAWWSPDPRPVIEAGAWRGGASILLRATLDALGDERTVWVADSFEGFPAVDDASRQRDQWSVIDYLRVSLDEVQASFARFGCERGVRFLPGFFEETLPGLSERRWALVRLDGDTYDATRLTLECLYPGLAAGGYLIVDDYGALEECREAVDEFRRRHDIAEPLEEVDWTGVRWRRETEAPIERSDATRPSGNGRSTARAVPRPPDARVPTFEELGLTREVEALRERLAAVEAEIERLTGSPVAAPRAWLRRKLDRGRSR